MPPPNTTFSRELSAMEMHFGWKPLMASMLPASMQKSKQQNCRENILFFVKPRTWSNIPLIPRCQSPRRAEGLHPKGS
jgi:hypothetical protein